MASYTGEFDALAPLCRSSSGSYVPVGDNETFFTTVRKFPAVWVTVGGSKPQGDAAAADLVGINLRY